MRAMHRCAAGCRSVSPRADVSAPPRSPPQANHRSWADFFLDIYLTQGRAALMSRWMVFMAFPVFCSAVMILRGILFFKRGTIMDKEVGGAAGMGGSGCAAMRDALMHACLCACTCTAARAAAGCTPLLRQSSAGASQARCMLCPWQLGEAARTTSGQVRDAMQYMTPCLSLHVAHVGVVVHACMQKFNRWLDAQREASLVPGFLVYPEGERAHRPHAPPRRCICAAHVGAHACSPPF